MPQLVDRTGQRIGDLFVDSRAESKGRHTRWNCICSCGARFIALAQSLSRGIDHCGCKDGRRRIETHKLSKTPEYRVWRAMIDRCHRKNATAYHHYGGRGVAVCDSWRFSFPAFYRDIGPKPSPKHTIERIDNDGNYEPGNVRWATRKEQARNRRSTRKIAHNGETHCIREWAEIGNTTEKIVRNRILSGKPPI